MITSKLKTQGINATLIPERRVIETSTKALAPYPNSSFKRSLKMQVKLTNQMGQQHNKQIFEHTLTSKNCCRQRQMPNDQTDT